MEIESNNREEIDSMLIEIQSKIGKVDSKELFNELDNVSKYRPLTSLYFNILAELYYFEKQYEKAIETLNGKENWWRPSKYAIKSAHILSKIYFDTGDKIKSKLYSNLEYYLSETIDNVEVTDRYVSINSNCLAEIQRKFINDEDKINCVSSMFDKYTELWRFTEAIIILALEEVSIKGGNLSYSLDNYIKEFSVVEPNMLYLWEQLISGEKETFILIADDNNDYITYEVLAKALSMLGLKVKLIAKPVVVDVEEPIDIRDTVEISMGNIENIDGYELLHPIEVNYKGEILGNNIALLTYELMKFTEDEYANVIATRGTFDYLSDTEELNMHIQCLSNYRGAYYDDFLFFGYLGKYTSYISRIYKFDYAIEISKESECEFSIVIPARNSAYTLEYTLKTCLEQRGMTDKDYEIIVSDNSTNGNKEVYNLVQYINDKRIKYYKTPRNLNLVRSFEFAISKARGEIIVPIGSDDGMLPWGLETLRVCSNGFPDNDVFAWDRGFFLWSEAKNLPNPGKFHIGSNYKKFEYNLIKYNCLDSLLMLIMNPEQRMYYVPTLYINSGFRRRYINKILDKTSRLWDGYTQDIYMSILNLLINEEYIHINYPITIAGMSDNSLGAKSSSSNFDSKTFSKVDKEAYDYAFEFGGATTNKYHIEHCGIDISAFYSDIFRFMENRSFHKILKPVLEEHDWKKTFKDIVNKLHPYNFNYMTRLNTLRHNAYVLGSDMGIWFDDNIYKECLENVYVFEEKTGQEDNYFTGFHNEGLILDARKFNVNNIYEATKLFENITNL